MRSSRVRHGRRWLTPTSILSAVAMLAVAFAIFAPQDASDDGRPLTSYSTSPRGARGLYEVLQRLGFPVRRRITSLAAPLDSTATFLILQPAAPLSTVELESLLRAVRRGATVVFTGGQRALTDSLGFDIDRSLDGFYTIASTAVTRDAAAAAPDERPDAVPRAGSRDIPRNIFAAVPISATVSLKPDAGAGGTVFMWLGRARSDIGAPDRSVQALVLGRPFGRGHAIAVSTGDLLTNQLLRDGRPAIAIVRALKWAHQARRAQGGDGVSEHATGVVVFDEYHHGFGTHADVVAAVEHALIATPMGRMTIQIAFAAVVLILAIGVRPLSPLASHSVQRRSPLEHVGALAHAYLQVDARRIGADRLVRGLRRRHPLGVARTATNETYLSALRTQLPATAPDVGVVTAAIAQDTTRNNGERHSFATVGAAIANIERTFEG